MKKIVFGLLVSALFIYLSLRGVEYEDFIKSLSGVKYFYLFPAVFLFLLTSVIRSLRWEVVLSPIKKIEQKSLFPITCVGYMAVVLIPMRIGEFVRPYLISIKKNVSLSSAIATILIERLLDVLIILFMFFVVIVSSDLPSWIVKSAYSIFVSFFLLLFMILLFYFKTDLVLSIIKPLLKKLPPKFHEKIENFLIAFIDGFKIIGSPVRLLYITFLSSLVWFFAGLALYFIMLSFNFELSLTAAFVVLIITIIGVSLPTAPGFLGNLQYACILALALFDISKSDAFAFSMVYFILGIMMNVLLGFLCMGFVNISFKDIYGDIRGRLGNSSVPSRKS